MVWSTIGRVAFLFLFFFFFSSSSSYSLFFVLFQLSSLRVTKSTVRVSVVEFVLTTGKRKDHGVWKTQFSYGRHDWELYLLGGTKWILHHTELMILPAVWKWFILPRALVMFPYECLKSRGVVERRLQTRWTSYFETPKWQIFCIVAFSTSNTSVCYIVRPVKYWKFLFECHIKLLKGLTCLLVGLIALIWFSWTARFHDYPGPRNSIDVTTCSIYNWNISSLTAPEKKWVKDCFLYLLNDI